MVGLFLASGWYLASGKVENNFPVLRGFPLDDAYIEMVYAQSLGTRGRLEYNPGIPEAGVSSLLWVGLESPWVAAARRLGHSPVLAIDLLNQLVVLALVFAVLFWTRHLSASDLIAAAAAGALLLEPALGFSRFSGMEVLLSATLLVAALFHWQRDLDFAAGALMALALLARPENIILLGLCLVCDGSRPHRLRRAFVLLLPSLILGGGWVLLNWAAAGRPLPNPFYVKAHVQLDLVAARRLIRAMILPLPYFKWVLGLGLYGIGAGLMLARHKLRALPAALFPWCFILGLACTREFPSYWPYYFHRYMQPCIPFLLVPWVMGAAWAVRAAGQAWRSRSALDRRQLALAGTGLVLLAASLLPWPGQVRYWRRLLASNCSNIQAIQVRIGDWVKNQTRPEDAIATYDAGAIRFYGERRTLDLAGLNNHELLANPVSTFQRWRPRYIVLPIQPGDPDPATPDWREYRLGPADQVWLRPVFSAAARHYTVADVHPNLQAVYQISYQAPEEIKALSTLSK